ncbi:MAG: SGNH/GDSL hydrolase family protein [Fuerstiella sp.]
MSLTTNSLGFRGPELVEERTDVLLCLGDSITLGYGVDDGAEYPRVLQRELVRNGRAQAQVINAGIGATGNGRWLRFLQTEAAVYSTDYVVLQTTGNDIEDNIRDSLYKLSSNGTLVSCSVSPPGLSRRLQQIIEVVPGIAYSHLFCLAREAAGRLRPAGNKDSGTVRREESGRPQEISQPEKLFLALIERSIELCRERGWPVLLVAVDFTPPRMEMLQSLARRHRVPVIAIPKKSQRPDLYFRVDGHLNSAGHKFVAAQVAAEVLGKEPAIQ